MEGRGRGRVGTALTEAKGRRPAEITSVVVSSGTGGGWVRGEEGSGGEGERGRGGGGGGGEGEKWREGRDSSGGAGFTTRFDSLLY